MQLLPLLLPSGSINQPQHHFRLVDFGKGTFYAHPLHRVLRGSDARRVDEAQQRVAHHHRFLHRVARGAADVAHQSPFLAHQRIQQRGLSRIRFPHNRHRHSPLQHIPQAERRAEACYVLVDDPRQREQFRAVGKFQVLMVRKVQFQLQQRRDVQQFVAQRTQFPAEAPPHLVHRHAVVRLRGRSDEVRHRLRLAQVHFPVEERPLRVLPGACHLAALLQQQFHNTVQDIGRAVAGNLRAVFTRVRVGSAEEAHQHLVHHLVGCGVNDASEGQRVARLLLQRLFSLGYKNSLGCPNGFRARYAHHAECSSRRCGYGTNG